jgi:hypothetical protein
MSGKACNTHRIGLAFTLMLLTCAQVIGPRPILLQCMSICVAWLLSRQRSHGFVIKKQIEVFTPRNRFAAWKRKPRVFSLMVPPQWGPQSLFLFGLTENTCQLVGCFRKVSSMRPLLVAAVSSATIMLVLAPQANARAKGEIGEVQSCLDSGKTALKERLEYCTWNYADLPEINYSGDNRGAAVEYAIKRRDRLAGCILPARSNNPGIIVATLQN